MKTIMLHVTRAVCALALLMAGLLGLTSPANAAGCTLAPTNGTETKTVGFRNYQLHVPAGLTGTQVPLLIDLHGGGGYGYFYEYITGWSSYADAKKNFIVAYPNSLTYGYWNYYGGSYDVPFIKSVADHIAATYCIDPKRIFIDGHSNGGLITDRLACDAADKFAAFAPYAGASSSQPPAGSGACNPSRKVPIAFFHGDSDSAAPVQYQKQNRDWWLAKNGCSTTPVHVTDTYGFLDTYACPDGAEIWWRELQNQNHDWPSGAEGEDQHDRMWAFFNAHPLP